MHRVLSLVGVGDGLLFVSTTGTIRFSGRSQHLAIERKQVWLFFFAFDDSL